MTPDFMFCVICSRANRANSHPVETFLSRRKDPICPVQKPQY
jgi:hypothetical protein